MLVVVWSLKGGAGCSVVTALLGLACAHAGRRVLLVDLGDDLAAVLGCAPAGSPTLADLCRLGVPLVSELVDDVLVEPAPGIRLLAGGSLGQRAEAAAAALAGLDRTVIVDAGVLHAGRDPAASILAGVASRSLLVTRPCYLALRRCVDPPVRPTGVILVDEAGRAFDAAAVAGVAGAPVVATVAVDTVVARAVDAGLLAARVPGGLLRCLRDVP